MRTSKHILMLLAMISILVACDNTLENVDAPDFVPKLVVVSLLSPADTTVTVNIRKNKPVFGEIKEPPSVEEATMIISDGEQSVQLTKSASGKFTVPQGQFAIEAGKTYTLNVTTPDGFSVDSKCTVPHQRELNITLDTLTVIEKNDWGSEDYLKLTIKFSDYPGESNYYRALVYVNTYYHTSGGTPYTSQVYMDKNLFWDGTKDGKQFAATANVYATEYKYSSSIDSAFLNIYVLNTGYEYYKYHQSLSLYSDIDFFTEVTPLYSNINHGLGVFGAYTKNEVKFRLK